MSVTFIKPVTTQVKLGLSSDENSQNSDESHVLCLTSDISVSQLLGPRLTYCPLLRYAGLTQDGRLTQSGRLHTLPLGVEMVL